MWYAATREIFSSLILVIRHRTLVGVRWAVLAEQHVGEDLGGNGPSGGEPILVAELEVQAAYHTRASCLGRGSGEAWVEALLPTWRRVGDEAEGDGIVTEETGKDSSGRSAERAVA